jgi:hypothetical protein
LRTWGPHGQRLRHRDLHRPAPPGRGAPHQRRRHAGEGVHGRRDVRRRDPRLHRLLRRPGRRRQPRLAPPEHVVGPFVRVGPAGRSPRWRRRSAAGARRTAWPSPDRAGPPRPGRGSARTRPRRRPAAVRRPAPRVLHIQCQ